MEINGALYFNYVFLTLGLIARYKTSITRVQRRLQLKGNDYTKAMLSLNLVTHLLHLIREFKLYY